MDLAPQPAADSLDDLFREAVSLVDAVEKCGFTVCSEGKSPPGALGEPVDEFLMTLEAPRAS